MPYKLIVQNTVDKTITSYDVEDRGTSKTYFIFNDVDMRGLKDGEHRYFVICDDGAPIKILQNDARQISNPEDRYIVVSENNILTADDFFLVVKGEEYQIPIPVLATGLMMVGDFVQNNTTYDKEQTYVQYSK